MLARANSPEEDSPWATIIARVPVHPQKDWFIRPAVSSPMCLTEEYAIRDFISGCRIQIILVSVAPQRAIEVIIGATIKFGGLEKETNRRIPNPPSFRRIAAKTIDPATGAST
jgi:hypothetical protein